MKQTNKNVPIIHGKAHSPVLSVNSRNKQKLRRAKLSMGKNLSGGPRHTELESNRISNETLLMLEEEGYYVEEYAGRDINGNPVYVRAGSRKHIPVEEMPEVSYKEPAGKPRHVKPVQPDTAQGKGARRFSGRAIDPVFYSDRGKFFGKDTEFKSEESEYNDSLSRPEFVAPKVDHTEHDLQLVCRGSIVGKVDTPRTVVQNDSTVPEFWIKMLQEYNRLDMAVYLSHLKRMDFFNQK